MKKNISITLLLLIQLSLISQQNTYNVFEISKGEIFKKDYAYITYLFNDLYSATLLDSITKTYKEHSTGIINENENIIVPFKYNVVQNMWDYESDTSKRLVTVADIRNKKGMCILDLNEKEIGKSIVENYRAYRYYLFDKTFIVGQNVNSDIINLKTGEIKKTIYEKIEPLNNVIASGELNNRKFIINENGNQVNINSFYRIRKLTDSLILVVNNDSSGVLNYVGEFVVPLSFKHIAPFYNILLTQTYNTGKPLKLNNNLKDKISDYSFTLNNSNSKVKTYYSADIENLKQNGKYGALDNKGNIIIPFDFEILEPGLNTNLIASKNNLFGIISKNGNVIIQHKYSNISIWKNKYYLLNYNSLCGLISNNFKEIMPTVYNQITPINDTSFFVLDKTQWYRVTIDSVKVTSKQKIELNSTYKINNIKYPNANSDDDLISENYFLLQKNGLFGIISEDSKIKITPIYNQNSDFSPFKNNYFEFMKNGSTVIFTLNGIELKNITTLYNYQKYLSDFIICIKDGKYGVVSQNGEVIIPFKYSEIISAVENKFIIKK